LCGMHGQPTIFTSIVSKEISIVCRGLLSSFAVEAMQIYMPPEMFSVATAVHF